MMKIYKKYKNLIIELSNIIFKLVNNIKIMNK